MTTAFEISMSPAVDAPPSDGAAADLYWLPLGAGGRSVRFNGLVFEAIAARLQHRTRSDLYHSALEVRVGSHRYVIEMAPVWNEQVSDPWRRQRGRRRQPPARPVAPVSLRDPPVA